MTLTPWQLSFQPLVPKVTDRLLPLVDKKYNFDVNLQSLDTHIFEFDHEFIAAICQGNQDKIFEQRQYDIFFSKYLLSKHTFGHEEFEISFQNRRQLEQKTGKSWDGEPTAYLKECKRLRLESDETRHKMIELKNQFNTRIFESWNHEIDTHATGEYQDYQTDDLETRKQLTVWLFDKNLPDMGFTHNKRLTRKTMLVYSKPVIDNWVLVLAVEQNEMVPPIEKYKPIILAAQHDEKYKRDAFYLQQSQVDRLEQLEFSKSSDGQICRPSSAYFKMYIGVSDSKTRKKLSSGHSQSLLFELAWFLPIRQAPLWTDYCRFYTLRELDALINLHIKFYQLLAPEYEKAVYDGLAETATCSPRSSD